MRRRYRNFRWWETGEPQEMLVANDMVAERSRSVSEEVDDVVDLGGKYLMPSFIDAHCHILPTGLDLLKLNLMECQTREEMLESVRDYALLEPGVGWLHAVQYDQMRFEDARHLTRVELDAISLTRPILIRHCNGHASVANSAALEAAGITEETPDPSGGSYVRDASGRLTGVLLERAHENVTSAAPMPTLDEMTSAILAAGEEMSKMGIACASDMMTGRWDLRRELEAYRLASERGCKVRMRLYMQWNPVLGSRGIPAEELHALTGAMDSERCRVAGVKIFADGAIGSATAAIYGQFLRKGPADGAAEDGQLIYSRERLMQMVRKADEAGWQIAIHSIGDRSTDLVMDAYAQTSEPSKHRIEHAMIMSDAQIDRFAALGCFCTMQPEFLHRFGHSYKKQLGPERAARLERFRGFLDRGIRLSFNSDMPIVKGDPWIGIRTAVRRPDGFDPAENVTAFEAIRAYTQAGADVNGDSGLMGSLLPGQVADFQVLERNPIEIANEG